MAKNDGTKKSRRLLIAVCIILTILIISAAAVVIFVGFDNIKAMYYGVAYDKKQIDNMIDESSTRLDDKVAEYSYIVAREPTQEEMDAVKNGEITEDQLAQMIASGMTLDEFRKNNEKNDSNNDNPKPDEPASGQEKSHNSPPPQVYNPPEDAPKQPAPQKPQKTQAELDAECDAQISQIVARMYILRSSFTSALSGLANQAYADYKAGVSKREIISRYLSQGRGLESQCDGDVSALMSELSGILTKYGRATELVDTMYEAYNNEKKYTKAYYMNMYLKK